MSGAEPAPRLSTLKGARIGLLDPGKRETGIALEAIGKRLVKEFGAEIAGTWKKPSAYRLGSKKLIEEIVPQCDAIVMGVVD
jgi:hypothetical protein